jgi:hypothetical protein
VPLTWYLAKNLSLNRRFRLEDVSGQLPRIWEKCSPAKKPVRIAAAFLTMQLDNLPMMPLPV